MSSTSVGIPTLRVNEPSRDKELEEEREEEIDMMDQKDRRNYKPEVVEYVWELLKANVAHHQVPAVIKSSLKFFGKRANSIPSAGIVNSMAVSCLPASQKHMEVTNVMEIAMAVVFPMLLNSFIK